MTEQLFSLKPRVETFRPVHYLGCKLRLLDVLEGLVDDLGAGQGRLLDLFSGAGVVAAHFAQRQPVLAADIQEYGRVLAEALMAKRPPTPEQIRSLLDEATAHRAALVKVPAFSELMAYEDSCLNLVEAAPLGVCAILEQGSIVRHDDSEGTDDEVLAPLLSQAAAGLSKGPRTVLTRHFGGVYFGYEQALTLDGLANAARAQESPFREIALAAVMSTASEIVSSIGNHFAQPVRPRDAAGRVKLGALKTVARRRRVSVIQAFLDWISRYCALEPPVHDAAAIRADYREVLHHPPQGMAVIYADPPYTRDHYSRYYHVLETIAVGDDPEVSRMTLAGETRISRGLYRADRHQSPFSIKSQAPEAFSALYAGAREAEVPLIVSYSPHGEDSATRPRLMAIDELVGLAGEFYEDVDVASAGRLSHSKLNAAHLNADQVYDAELFIVCRP